MSLPFHPLLRNPRTWLAIGVIAGADKDSGPMMFLFLTDDCYIFNLLCILPQGLLSCNSYLANTNVSTVPDQT